MGASEKRSFWRRLDSGGLKRGMGGGEEMDNFSPSAL